MSADIKESFYFQIFNHWWQSSKLNVLILNAKCKPVNNVDVYTCFGL